MKVGSTFAYESTQSIATNGAIRQSAITTLVGVTVGAFGGFAPVSSVMRRLRPLADHLCNAQEI